MNNEKSIYWIGTSYKNVCDFPDEAKRDTGYQLHRVQNGLDPEDWKPFSAIGQGVREIRIRSVGNAYRVMYISKFKEKIYILHAFQKKTQKTNKHDIEIAKSRYQALLKEVAHEK